MTFSAILFYILAAIVLYGAVRTVTAKKPCARRFAFGADLLRERDDLDADAGRVFGRDAGGGLRRRRDGVVPVRRDDVEHRH